MSKCGKSLTTEALCGCGDLYVTTIFDTEMNIKDLKIHFGKAGGCASATTAAIQDLTAVAIAENVPVHRIIEALKGHSCHQSNKQAQPPIPSCIEAISEILRESAAKIADA